MLKLAHTFFLVLILMSCQDDKNIKMADSVSVDPATEGPMVMLPDSIEALGEALFHEKVLSLDYSISCASCHIPEYGFSDTVAFSVGVGGKLGARNSPPLMNIIGYDLFFYDGRATSLEDQVHFPIEDPNEMNVSMDTVVERLKIHREYKEWFQVVFNEAPNRDNIAKAIAAFERTLETADTPLDDHANEHGDIFLSEAQLRGQAIFNDPKNKCFDCHQGVDFTNFEFRNIGLYDGVMRMDLGRFNITKDSSDIGKFKVPGLRNIAITAPYMHDGSMKTLREVLEYYNDPYKVVANPINMDSLMTEPLNLSEQELDDLEAFLHSLTDRQFDHLKMKN